MARGGAGQGPPPPRDINLLGPSPIPQEKNPTNIKPRIFPLAHDSILAEVPEEEVDIYSEKLKYWIQLDRGIKIPGAPVGCDFEIGDDYSMGKFEKQYGVL